MNSKIVMDFGTVIVVISSAFTAWKFAEFCHSKLPDIDPGGYGDAGLVRKYSQLYLTLFSDYSRIRYFILMLDEICIIHTKLYSIL